MADCVDGSPDPGGKDAARVVALARQGERTARRVGELENFLAQLSADVTGLASVLTDSTPGPGADGDDADAPPGMRSWLLADDPDQAAADLAELIGWVDRVYLAYHGAVLPSCWLWHPDVVEELWWLHCAHADAYHHTHGSWLRVGNWQDQMRPGVVKRVRAAVGSCELALHVPGADRAGLPAPAPLAAAAADIAGWVAAGRPDPAPAPTDAQLGEAERHERAQHGSWR